MKKVLFVTLLALSMVCRAQEQTVTLKQYIDMQAELTRELAKQNSDANRLFFEAEVKNINDNVAKAYLAYDKRLEGMNEFRQTLQDSNRTYVTWQSLLSVIVGAAGLLFGYSNYQKNKNPATNSGQNIKSGDTVEVKK